MPARFSYSPGRDGRGPVFSCRFAESDLTLAEAIEVVHWCRDAFGHERNGRWNYRLDRLEMTTLEVKRTSTVSKEGFTVLQMQIGLTAVADADRFKLRWSWSDAACETEPVEAAGAQTPWVSRIHRL